MDQISDKFKNGSDQTNDGRVSPLDCQSGHYRHCEQRSFVIFCWIFMKLADNNDIHKISNQFANGSDRPKNGRVMSP